MAFATSPLFDLPAQAIGVWRLSILKFKQCNEIIATDYINCVESEFAESLTCYAAF
jgi:hypothetical protein